MRDDLTRLADVSNEQRGAVTSAQLQAAGVDAGRRWRRVQSGGPGKVGVRTYRSPFVPPSELSDLHALVLDCGRERFVSGPTAAALLGLDGFRLRAPFHVTIVRGRNVARVGHSVHTTTDLPLVDRARAHGLPVLAPGDGSSPHDIGVDEEALEGGGGQMSGGCGRAMSNLRSLGAHCSLRSRRRQ